MAGKLSLRKNPLHRCSRGKDGSRPDYLAKPTAANADQFSARHPILCYPITALRISDSTSFNLEDLQQGDTVYVRGKGSPGDPNLQATLVLKGGMRGILGTLLQVGNASVTINEFGTGRTLDISIPSAMIYRTTREMTASDGVPRLDESRLATILFTDLQPGDTVLIIGVTDFNTNKGTGLGLISQFGHFGSVPNDKGNQLSWFLAK